MKFPAKKFRVWHPYKKTMFYGDDCEGDNADEINLEWIFDRPCATIELNSYFGYTACEFLPITQWTGLTDHTGKDIYEGDVMEHNGVVKHRGIVLFEGGAFYMRTGRGMFARELVSKLLRNYCVIGNVIENPDLENGIYVEEGEEVPDEA